MIELLLTALRRGDKKFIRECLASMPIEQLLEMDAYGSSILHYLARYGYLEELKLVRERFAREKAQGTPIPDNLWTAVNTSGYSPFLASVHYNQKEVVQYFLDENLDKFASPLHEDVFFCRDNVEVTDEAAKAVDALNLSPLDYAVIVDNQKKFKLLFHLHYSKVNKIKLLKLAAVYNYRPELIPHIVNDVALEHIEGLLLDNNLSSLEAGEPVEFCIDFIEMHNDDPAKIIRMMVKDDVVKTSHMIKLAVRTASVRILQGLLQGFLSDNLTLRQDTIIAVMSQAKHLLYGQTRLPFPGPKGYRDVMGVAARACAPDYEADFTLLSKVLFPLVKVNDQHIIEIIFSYVTPATRQAALMYTFKGVEPFFHTYDSEDDRKKLKGKTLMHAAVHFCAADAMLAMATNGGMYTFQDKEGRTVSGMIEDKRKKREERIAEWARKSQKMDDAENTRLAKEKEFEEMSTSAEFHVLFDRMTKSYAILAKLERGEKLLPAWGFSLNLMITEMIAARNKYQEQEHGDVLKLLWNLLNVAIKNKSNKQAIIPLLKLAGNEVDKLKDADREKHYGRLARYALIVEDYQCASVMLEKQREYTVKHVGKIRMNPVTACRVLLSMVTQVVLAATQPSLPENVRELLREADDTDRVDSWTGTFVLQYVTVDHLTLAALSNPVLGYLKEVEKALDHYLSSPILDPIDDKGIIDSYHFREKILRTYIDIAVFYNRLCDLQVALSSLIVEGVAISEEMLTRIQKFNSLAINLLLILEKIIEIYAPFLRLSGLQLALQIDCAQHLEVARGDKAAVCRKLGMIDEDDYLDEKLVTNLSFAYSKWRGSAKLEGPSRIPYLIYKAAKRGDTVFAQTLCDKLVVGSMLGVDSIGSSLGHYLVDAGAYAVIEHLYKTRELQDFKDIFTAKNTRLFTPMAVAILRGRTNIIDLFIGTDIDKFHYITHRAAYYGLTSFATRDKGQSIDSTGAVELEVAISGGRRETVEALLAVTPKEFINPFMLLWRCLHANQLELLDIIVPRLSLPAFAEKGTLIIEAVYHYYDQPIEVIGRILSYLPDQLRDDFELVAMRHAASCGRANLMLLLLDMRLRDFPEAHNAEIINQIRHIVRLYKTENKHRVIKDKVLSKLSAHITARLGKAPDEMLTKALLGAEKLATEQSKKVKKDDLINRAALAFVEGNYEAAVNHIWEFEKRLCAGETRPNQLKLAQCVMARLILTCLWQFKIVIPDNMLQLYKDNITKLSQDILFMEGAIQLIEFPATDRSVLEKLEKAFKAFKAPPTRKYKNPSDYEETPAEMKAMAEQLQNLEQQIIQLMIAWEKSVSPNFTRDEKILATLKLTPSSFKELEELCYVYRIIKETLPILSSVYEFVAMATNTHRSLLVVPFTGTILERNLTFNKKRTDYAQAEFLRESVTEKSATAKKDVRGKSKKQREGERNKERIEAEAAAAKAHRETAKSVRTGPQGYTPLPKINVDVSTSKPKEILKRDEAKARDEAEAKARVEAKAKTKDKSKDKSKDKTKSSTPAPKPSRATGKVVVVPEIPKFNPKTKPAPAPVRDSKTEFPTLPVTPAVAEPPEDRVVTEVKERKEEKEALKETRSIVQPVTEALVVATVADKTDVAPMRLLPTAQPFMSPQLTEEVKLLPVSAPKLVPQSFIEQQAMQAVQAVQAVSQLPFMPGAHCFLVMPMMIPQPVLQRPPPPFDRVAIPILNVLFSLEYINGKPHAVKFSGFGLHFNVSAMLVGGAMRDAIRGVDCKDGDIVLTWTEEEITSRFPDRVKNGKKVGKITYTIRRDGYDIDLKHVTNLEEDSAQRDFTMNNIYGHPFLQAFKKTAEQQFEPVELNPPHIIDPSDGIDAINRGEIVLVDRKFTPDQNIFIEDRKKVFRLMRFEAKLSFTPEVRIIHLVKTHNRQNIMKFLSEASKEFLTEQYDKIVEDVGIARANGILKVYKYFGIFRSRGISKEPPKEEDKLLAEPKK